MTVWGRATKKSILSFLGYYKRFGLCFVRGFWHARGKPLGAFVLVTVITLLFPHQDQTTWPKIRVAILANVITFSIFALWHLVRTPWLLTTEQDSNLRGRIEKLGIDLLRLLKAQGPEPANTSVGSDRLEYAEKVRNLYLADYALRVSAIRHEIMARKADADLDRFVDNPYFDHNAVHRLAVKLLEVACAMRTDELIKSV
jgi:hypothetical protein